MGSMSQKACTGTLCQDLLQRNVCTESYLHERDVVGSAVCFTISVLESTMESSSTRDLLQSAVFAVFLRMDGCDALGAH